MKLATAVLQGVILLFVFGTAAFGADSGKAQKQAEIRKAVQTTLERFYKANPKLKSEVAGAPGYAVFTTFGISFIVGGAGGHGAAHDRKTGRYTYMNMAQASVGVQIGAAQSETLIIFKTANALAQFVDKGWEFGGGGTVGAGAGGKSVEVPGGGGENVIADALYYTLTKNGLQAGGAVAGSKFWKDADLN
jgi:lipid-binding SYLF domain-containing protein